MFFWAYNYPRRHLTHGNSITIIINRFTYDTKLYKYIAPVERHARNQLSNLRPTSACVCGSTAARLAANQPMVYKYQYRLTALEIIVTPRESGNHSRPNKT